MSRELVERLRIYADKLSAAELFEAADLIERQDILIKEMAATLQNMALSLRNKDTEE